jgi:hypothetical protein
MKSKILGLAAGLALAVATSLPAQAQFMSSPYPVIIVPPPAQKLVVPKPAPKQAEPPKTAAPPPDAPPSGLGNCYQGRTKVC